MCVGGHHGLGSVVVSVVSLCALGGHHTVAHHCSKFAEFTRLLFLWPRQCL